MRAQRFARGAVEGWRPNFKSSAILGDNSVPLWLTNSATLGNHQSRIISHYGVNSMTLGPTQPLHVIDCPDYRRKVPLSGARDHSARSNQPVKQDSLSPAIDGGLNYSSRRSQSLLAWAKQSPRADRRIELLNPGDRGEIETDDNRLVSDPMMLDQFDHSTCQIRVADAAPAGLYFYISNKVFAFSVAQEPEHFIKRGNGLS